MSHELSRTSGNPLEDAVAFPVLSAEELAQGEEFGTCCSFAQGEALFSAGDHPFDCYVILSGEVCIVDVSTGERTCVIRYGEGHFTGDIDLFTGRPAVVTAEAETAVEAVRIPPVRLREMFVRRPVLGERLWRAMQRRRELLLETGFQGLRVYGDKGRQADVGDCGISLSQRGAAPLDEHRRGRERPANPADCRVGRRPALACRHLRQDVAFPAPSLLQLAEHIGLRHRLPEKTYDVLVLGSGAVGSGRGGLRGFRRAFHAGARRARPGRTGGSSSKIENYAGFPNGVAGRELAQLAYLQALKFGAEFVAPCHVNALRRGEDGLYRVHTREGDAATGKTVIVATGVSYRLLDVEGLNKLKGSGVYYNATAVEALLCKTCPVHVIGAGNSAGQAAMFFPSTPAR